MVVLSVECLATFNACFADPAWHRAGRGLPFGEFFAILVVGIAISLAGAVQLALGLRLGPVRSVFEIPPALPGRLVHAPCAVGCATGDVPPSLIGVGTGTRRHGGGA